MTAHIDDLVHIAALVYIFGVIMFHIYDQIKCMIINRGCINCVVLTHYSLTW